MSKLFIYIPTYNRPAALTSQLTALLPQVAKFPNEVRLMINDNASTDKISREILDKYSSSPNIEFRSNGANVGGNANIAFGFIFAQPTDDFLWILSDNDIVSPNALDYLLEQIDTSVDFYCFNNTVAEPKVIDYPWSKGWMTPMDWRMGLISDALYNVKSVKESSEAAFYFHNSSFPHLAVAAAAAKKLGVVKFKILPRNKINNDLYRSDEHPTDYSLAHVCMPLLVPLFPADEAKSFSISWLKGHGANLYRNRNRHYHLYLQSKATLSYYGGWQAKILLLIMWPVYFLSIPTLFVRQKLVTAAKENLSVSMLDKLKNFRRIICGR